MKKIKKKISWKFLSSRRGMKLENFIRKANNVQEALEHFDKHNLSPPSIELIELALQANVQESQKIQEPSVELIESNDKQTEKQSEITVNVVSKKKGKKKQNEMSILVEESDYCERIDNEDIRENTNTEELSASSEETVAVEEIFPENVP